MTDESTSEPGDLSYQDRLGATLKRRDPTALRAFLLEQASAFGDEQQVQAISGQSDADIEMLMHRMILARADLASLHAASRAALGTDAGPQKRSSGPPRRRR